MQVNEIQRGDCAYLRAVHLRIADYIQFYTFRRKRDAEPKRIVSVNASCQQGDIDSRRQTACIAPQAIIAICWVCELVYGRSHVS